MAKIFPIIKKNIIVNNVTVGDEVNNERLIYELPEKIQQQIDDDSIVTVVSDFAEQLQEEVLASPFVSIEEIFNSEILDSLTVSVDNEILEQQISRESFAIVDNESVSEIQEFYQLEFNFFEFVDQVQENVNISYQQQTLEQVDQPNDEFELRYVVPAQEIVPTQNENYSLQMSFFESLDSQSVSDSFVISSSEISQDLTDTVTFSITAIANENASFLETGSVIGNMPASFKPPASVVNDPEIGASWTTPEAVQNVISGDVKRSTAQALGVAVGIFTPSEYLTATNFNILIENGGFIPLGAIITDVKFECRGLATGNTQLLSVATGVLEFQVLRNGVQVGTTQSVSKLGSGDGPYTTLAVNFPGTPDSPQTTINRADLANGALTLRARANGTGGTLLTNVSASVAYFRIQIDYRLDF